MSARLEDRAGLDPDEVIDLQIRDRRDHAGSALLFRLADDLAREIDLWADNSHLYVVETVHLEPSVDALFFPEPFAGLGPQVVNNLRHAIDPVCRPLGKRAILVIEDHAVKHDNPRRSRVRLGPVEPIVAAQCGVHPVH